MNTRDVDIFGYSLGGSVSEMMNPVERTQRVMGMDESVMSSGIGSLMQ